MCVWFGFGLVFVVVVVVVVVLGGVFKWDFFSFLFQVPTTARIVVFAWQSCKQDTPVLGITYA